MRDCANSVQCTACVEAGRPANHRLGGPSCWAFSVRGKAIRWVLKQGRVRRKLLRASRERITLLRVQSKHGEVSLSQSQSLQRGARPTAQSGGRVEGRRSHDFGTLGHGETRFWCRRIVPSASSRIFCTRSRGRLIGSGGSRPILVRGDFNAKHVSWSGYGNNARGRLLKEWFDSRHFAVRNQMGAETCPWATGESAIDLTVSSFAAAAWVSSWEVLSDFESLSDHAYLAFSFGAPRSSGGLPLSSVGLAPTFRPGGACGRRTKRS